MIDKGTFMTDFASVQKHLTAITTAQTDFAKSSFEANKAYFEKLASVKSPDNFLPKDRIPIAKLLRQVAPRRAPVRICQKTASSTRR
jgi:Phasin protein